MMVAGRVYVSKPMGSRAAHILAQPEQYIVRCIGASRPALRRKSVLYGEKEAKRRRANRSVDGPEPGIVRPVRAGTHRWLLCRRVVARAAYQVGVLQAIIRAFAR